MKMKTAQISALFEYTGERLRQLAVAGFFPKPKRGKWEFDAVAVGLVKWLRGEVRRMEGERIVTEKKKQEKLDEEIAALRRKNAERDSVKLDDVVAAWRSAIVVARQRLEQSGLSKAEVEAICDELSSADLEIEQKRKRNGS